MAQRPSPVVLLGRATQRTLADLPILVPAAMVFAGLGHVAMWQAARLFQGDHGGDQTAELLSWYIPEAITGLIWCIFAYPLMDAIAIHCWRSHDSERPAFLADAWDFAKRRYRVMLKPHAASYVTITLGMTIAIPGIIFGLWYAFVDAITATQDGVQKPLAMSQKLTQGVRRDIFLAWFPYAIWFVLVFGNPWTVLWLEGQGFWWVLGAGTIDGILLIVMEMAMFGLFEARMAQLRERRAAREAQQEAQATAE